MIIKDDTELSTDIYYKATDAKQYLTFSSCHPSHTKRSISYNLARGICTIVSNRSKRDERLYELKQAFLNRGYPIFLIENGIPKATQIPRAKLLSLINKSDDDIIT